MRDGAHLHDTAMGREVEWRGGRGRRRMWGGVADGRETVDSRLAQGHNHEAGEFRAKAEVPRRECEHG